MNRLLLVLLVSLPASADPFINLTFDDPDLSGPLVPVYPGGPMEGSTAQLLRGWKATAGGIDVTSMTYSLYPVGSGDNPFSLVQNSTAEAGTTFGANRLWLRSTFTRGELRLEQTGTIPPDAAQLWISSTGYIQAFANGVKIGDFDPRSGAPQVLDVSPFAGQEISLEFLVRSGDSTRFDIFGFTPVPEPSTWALVGVGALCLGWTAMRGRQRG